MRGPDQLDHRHRITRIRRGEQRLVRLSTEPGDSEHRDHRRQQSNPNRQARATSYRVLLLYLHGGAVVLVGVGFFDVVVGGVVVFVGRTVVVGRGVVVFVLLGVLHWVGVTVEVFVGFGVEVFAGVLVVDGVTMTVTVDGSVDSGGTTTVTVDGSAGV
ncbi:hypothetical protein ACWDYH_31575 [Nocardia goodfellowii]